MRTLMAGLAGLAALSLGCSSGRSAPSEPAPKPGAEQTRVKIDNQNYSDMNIYLIDSGTRLYLGSANGLSSTTLTIPRGMARPGYEVRLLADPIGGSPAIRTPGLVVGPGQSVYWTIGSTPDGSFASTG
ncbi:MAG TPA: hypothetical protein VH680_05675 [Gemmatimonadales bacterium]|jgi:hypothetical protein